MSPPVIDIAALRSSSDVPLEIVESIDVACTEIGFFVVTGHGIEAQVGDVFHTARELFAMPEATKEVLAMVDRQGFVPAHHAVLDHSLHSAPAEYYDIGTRGDGRWPSATELPSFRAVVTRYQQAALGVAADLLQALAVALDLTPTFFADRMRDPQCFLRMFHYEPPEPGRKSTVLTDPRQPRIRKIWVATGCT